MCSKNKAFKIGAKKNPRNISKEFINITVRIEIKRRIKIEKRRGTGQTISYRGFRERHRDYTAIIDLRKWKTRIQILRIVRITTAISNIPQRHWTFINSEPPWYSNEK